MSFSELQTELVSSGLKVDNGDLSILESLSVGVGNVVGVVVVGLFSSSLFLEVSLRIDAPAGFVLVNGPPLLLLKLNNLKMLE